MLYPKNKSPRLDDTRFQNLTSEYRGALMTVSVAGKRTGEIALPSANSRHSGGDEIH